MKTIKEEYKIDEDLRKRFVNAIAEISAQGISGGLKKYKKNECSCCYSLRDTFYQINENIPGNWSIFDAKEGYHKISFTMGSNEKAHIVAKSFKKFLRSSGWKLSWDGTDQVAMMIKKTTT